MTEHQQRQLESVAERLDAWAETEARVADDHLMRLQQQRGAANRRDNYLNLSGIIREVLSAVTEQREVSP
jgi:rubrerythrin